MLATSCQYFETEKISSETFYEEEIKAIDWENIDQYPTFPQCETFIEKMERKKCFVETLQGHVSRSLSSKNMSSHQDLRDTVLLNFTISNTGEISQLNITVDSLLSQEIPMLRQWLKESIDSLPELSPAQKKGIPVETQFTFPVVVTTEMTTN